MGVVVGLRRGPARLKGWRMMNRPAELKVLENQPQQSWRLVRLMSPIGAVANHCRG
jgi:hypothetical protein